VLWYNNQQNIRSLRGLSPDATVSGNESIAI
jgi:hypothetical protein